MGIDYQFPFLGICRSAINTCLYGYGRICVVDEVNPNSLWQQLWWSHRDTHVLALQTSQVTHYSTDGIESWKTKSDTQNAG